jgi:DNA gyrase/topoisomerase IV subunit A
MQNSFEEQVLQQVGAHRGDVIGKYHPGDQSVYDALVRQRRISPCACR